MPCDILTRLIRLLNPLAGITAFERRHDVPNTVYQEPLVASLLLVVRPGAPSSFLLLIHFGQVAFPVLAEFLLATLF